MALLRKLARQSTDVAENEINSIIDNLNHVLNTTRDYGYFLPNFGISDYKYLSTREDINKAIIKDIIQNIELFEPRLELKTIEGLAENQLSQLSFRIDCVVRSNAFPIQLFLNPTQDRYQISS
jgi:type VI secretion system lysozyme-like protein